jgi:hypothetical protein
MGDRTTNGLKPGQVARLLAFGVEGTDSVDILCDVKALARQLHEQLTTALPKDSFLLEPLAMIVKDVGGNMQSLAGRSLGAVLLDAESDVSLLRAIKDYSKQLSFALVSEAEIAIAITIYYAALASSLVHHDKKITQYSYETLEQYFTTLTNKKWMDTELTTLFSQARNVCRSRRGKK